MRWRHILIAAVLPAAAGSFATGCVRRTITITTEPPGALVWLNDREIGRSPVDIDFEHYGTYDVRLERPGYEPVMTSGTAQAPLWEFIGVDLLAELAPFRIHNHLKWHYVLVPRNDDPEPLVDRAQRLRSRIADGDGSGP